MIWLLIAVLAVGTIAFKVLGPLLAGGVQPPAPLARVIGLLTPALLTALVVVSTFGDERRLVLDARAAGVVVGVVLLLLRVPLIVTLLGAALVTGIVRALGWLA